MLLEESSTEEDSSVESCCELALNQIQSEISERNTNEVENVALAAMGYGSGLQAAAAIAPAAWINDRIITQGSTNFAFDFVIIKICVTQGIQGPKLIAFF